ncbi:uncharacterized protein F5147DRAFT_696116 [Suillus discolor]|uniref:Uncharacterized protein n=1 Tax=Suillus discolor TaxID=1912936 RepID=A0A9P7F7H8_9AGAM|nr:uncharacterized protein F5147DRAFT_696116 [Suillus discolor]KAG2107999.1 hypothetical protein F5147DRAFT_696116 [Suillus discolor]
MADKLSIEFALIHRKYTNHMLILAARTFHEKGAKTTRVLISHGLFAEVHMASLNSLLIEQRVVTNTIPQNEHKEQFSKL